MKILKIMIVLVVTFIVTFFTFLLSDNKQKGYTIGNKKITFFFAWYDIWCGLFVDQKKKGVKYICVLPCLVIKVENIIREKNDNN